MPIGWRPSRPGVTAGRIPLSLFGIPVGLAGLVGTWLSLAHYHWAPAAQLDARPSRQHSQPAQPLSPCNLNVKETRDVGLK